MKIEEALLWFSDVGIYFVMHCEMDARIKQTIIDLITTVKQIYHLEQDMSELSDRHLALVQVSC